MLDINNPKNQSEMMLYGKAKGIMRAKKYGLPTFSHLYIIQKEEELLKISDELPDKFYMRADIRVGNKPIPISGQNGDKEIALRYLRDIKKKNPSGVALIFYGLENGFCESYNADGGIYVDFDVNNAVYIDYVGKGFDGREISHGSICQESYTIPWDEVLFFESKYMDQYRRKMITDEEYQEQRQIRKKHLIKENLKEEFLEEKIPQKYEPLKKEMMQEAIDQIILPLYKSDLKYTNREYVAMCNIEHNKIIVSELYTPERHKLKEDDSR